MYRIERTGPGGQFIKKIRVTWSDHRYGCTKCQAVDLNKTSTFTLACAEGSPLLAEHAVKMNLPAQKEKEKKILDWAKKAGVFKIP